MKKYLIHLLVSLFALTLTTACNEDPAAIDNAPEVFVYEAEDVMRTSAVLSGRLVASAQSNVREYGFLVGPTSDLTTAETRSYPIKGGTGDFSVQVVDLEIGTPYFYAVYASNGLEKMLSTVMAFTTPTRSGVLITELQLVDETTATVSARIADNGGGEINAVGFCWGTDEKPTIFTGENCFTRLEEDNTFTASLPLTAGATYSIRAFADSDITGDGTTTISYSQPISIRLEEEPMVEDRWAICGTMNDWGDLWMEWNEELGYFVLYDLTISDEDEFRIRANGTWDNQFGLQTDAENLVSINEMAILTKDEGGNTQTIRPTEAGVYDLYFNPERPELWIMTTGYKPGETPEIEPTPIGEIDTADKEYKVRATVVYSLPSICILDDGTGLIPYYPSSACPTVGTEIELYGRAILIDQILNISYVSSQDDIEVISEGNPVNYHPEQMDSELIAELLNGDRCREVTFTAQYDALTNSYWVDGQLISFMWTWDLDWEIPQQEVEVTGYYVGKFATDLGYQLRVLPREVTAIEEPLTLISAITETDAIYTVEGTVTAAQERAYILADKSGAILVYGSDHGRSIGDRIRITARASAYDHMIQLNTADAVVELLSTGNSWNYNPTVMDGSQLDELIGTTVCREIQFSGDLYLSGPYAEMTVQGATVTPSLSYCDNSQYTLGYNEIKGYYIGYTDRYLKVLTYSSDTGEINPEHCKIYYTTADNYALNISDTDAAGTNLFGANLLSDVYNNGQGVLTFDGPVTTIGDFAFYLCGTMTSIVIPESVTSIGRFAFMDCTNLPTVTIPESVVSIGEGAFSRCDNLAEFKSSFASSDGRCLIVEKTLNSFAPKEMTQYTVPEGIVKIGNSAFENCTLMEQIHLPQSVTEIDDDAFAYCTSLIALDIPDKVTRIGDNALSLCGMIKTLTLPETLESIGVQAFVNCAWLESVYCYATEPPVATSSYTGSTIVGQGEWNAFQFVSATAKIYVPAASESAYKAAAGWKDYAGMIYAMTNPEDTMIYYTTSDGSIVKPSDTSSFGVNIVSNTYENGHGVITFDGEVTTIGDYAFFLCENLTSVTLPNCVTSIGSRAFGSCFLLERINLPNNIVSIADHAFFSCKGLTSVTLPESLTSLGEGAFGGCSGLTSFDGKFATADHSAVIVDGEFIAFAPACGATEYAVPDGVTIIGDNAFLSCNLTSITLPQGVETIKDYAFDNCTKITTVTIPASVTSIGHAAFSMCSKLAEVYCLPTTPPTGFISYDANEWRAFYGNATDRKIYVPATSLSAYKTAAYWSDYADAIYPMDSDIPDTWKIHYTSTDGNIVEPFDSEAFGANILSNTIEYDPITMMAMGVITFDGPVTTIGENAFLGKETLATLTIPENVTRIAKSAFESCKYLIGIEIPENVTTIGEYAFSNCQALADLSLDSGLTSIGNSAFSGCISLTSVLIPDSVTSIGNSAFMGCGHLLEITLSSNLELIDDFLLSSCSALQQINIPDRVKEIGYQAFSNCTALSNVSFGSGLERIGGEAFRYCTSLMHVELPYGLTFVGNLAFGYCYALQQVTMPESVTTLEPYAFDHCLELTEFSMPGKVTEVSSGLFYSCIKLQTVRLHDTITAIGDSAFYHCNSLTDITIPNSVTSLGNDTFNGCTSLRTVNIPNGVTAIGMDTFFGCEGITEITLHDQINSIGDDAFYGCKSLTEITIPASVASIGNSAFSSCESLTACYCLPTTPPAGANYMFDYNASERKIYVPAESVAAYKTAPYWSNYADAIYAMDGESGVSAAGHKIYFKPSSNWKKDGALFAAYLYTVNSSPFMEQWVPMTESKTWGIYEMAVPIGFNYNDGLIFVRMSNLTPENAYSWQYMWNQTVDLFFYDDGNDLFVLTDDGWEDGRSGRGIWYNYNDYILTMNTSNTWGVCGEFTNWGGISDIPMNEDSASGMFVAYNVEMEKDAEFKIRANNAWEESYGSQSSSSAYATINDRTPLYFATYPTNIKAPAAGIYDLYFDLKNLQLWLMRQGLKPGEKSAAPTISWRGHNIDNSYNYTDGMLLIMDVTAQGGVAEFTVDIDSDVLTQEELLNVGLDSHLDLVNPGAMEGPLEALAFPTKENVVGQSAITFDLTPFGEVINNMANHSFYTNFTYTVTDAEGQRVQKTLQLRFHAGSGTTTEQIYLSDAAFTCTGTDADILNRAYSLGDQTTVDGMQATGVKLGASSYTGLFTSSAVGVSGNKRLSFGAVAWNGKTATLYVRVDGVQVASFELQGNEGAANNPPYTITTTATDFYEVNLSGLNASSVVEFSTSPNYTSESGTNTTRAILFGIRLS